MRILPAFASLLPNVSLGQPAPPRVLGGKRVPHLLVLTALLLGLFAPSTASAYIITFDELPVGTIVDGMVIGDVTFGFSSSSFDATITGCCGNSLFTQSPSILGGSVDGVLTLDFATPVVSVEYGFALNGFDHVDPGSTMELFDTGGDSLGIFTGAAASSWPGGVEGFNSGASGTPIGSARIVFFSAPMVTDRFLFDNLSAAPIPEPPSALVFGIGALIVGAALRRGSY